MPEMLKTTSMVIGAGLGQDAACVTDGRFSGGTHGFTVGHVVPVRLFLLHPFVLCLLISPFWFNQTGSTRRRTNWFSRRWRRTLFSFSVFSPIN